MRKWIASTLVAMVLIGCSSGGRDIVLPSQSAPSAPEWVDGNWSTRDSIFVVVHIPAADGESLDNLVQQAQSEMHRVLLQELEISVRQYWAQSEAPPSEDEMFNRMAKLPITLESVMEYVVVKDGWEDATQMSFLCAMDYEQMAEVLAEDLKLQDPAFRSYLKRSMAQLSKKYR